jgi:nucleoside-diphosphate-sugar epimerase
VRVLVLGAAGFIGSRVVDALLGRADVTGVVASDLRAPTAASPGAKMRFVAGDVLDPALFEVLFAEPVDAVFHLAASLTLDAESDFARGLQVNVHALMRLLEHCRAQAIPPKFLFASSISSFGGALPRVVDDHVFQTPQTSYGTHKAIAEQLINDYSRRGFVDGRVLRLPIVLTHPGPPTASVSDRIASLIREPLNGRDTVCALAPDTPLALASVDSVVAGLLRLLDLPKAAFGSTRALNLPALTATPGDLVAAVERAMPGASARVRWTPDATLQRVVDGWPSVFTSKFALEHGIRGDASADALVAAYLGARDGR